MRKGEKLTVRKFMLRKFPTSKFIDCPVPQHHWKTIQEYAEEYSKDQREQLLAFTGWLYGNIDKDIEIRIVDKYLDYKNKQQH